MDKNKVGLGLLLYKIVECARMKKRHPRAFDDPRGRFFVRATSETLQQRGGAIQVAAYRRRK